MESTVLTTHAEKTVAGKKSVKQKLRLIIAGLMVIFLMVIAFYAIRNIDGIPYHHFYTYIAKCFAIWAKSLAYSELVLVIGGFLLYMLREHGRPL